MNPVTPEMIDYYTRLLKDLRQVDDYVTGAIFWMVVRGRDAPLTVADVIRRLGADPGATTPSTVPRLIDPGWAVLEQSDHGVIVMATNTAGPRKPETWARLTEAAQTWGFWWLVNNANRLFYAADGHLVTELNILRPEPVECKGQDPRALDAYLGALRALADRKRADDRAGTYPDRYRDWETALATMEGMTGVRLDVDRFTREQPSIHAPGLG
ncbi:hypothetical protein SAMN05216276_101019 [Streptosporangium subroseum]|uniref:Uncharacterized protein n=1 Tax=Streptosporangium subroseum TaxID=106412 RepID=A0A239ERW0_9ACTN|nr:hypothetical protein [Streptosporangium subroseum]SNS46988.1 hypothetical protein SAMN05216276_101019 [Streptosporangium subroseum]